MKKGKIEIKNRWTGNVLFEYEKENNTIKDTLSEAVKGGADLRGADLRGADLRGADLSKTDLRGADLRGADLSGTYLSGAYLSGADLSETDLSGADLRGADLRGADLSGAYLRGAYLYVSDFEIDEKEIINNFEESTGLKLTEAYINHDIYPTRWNCFWKNGLIIRKYEVAPIVKEVKKMTVSEICKELGYEVEIIKEQNNENKN